MQLKHWWFAEQVGVDRKTVTRWVQGKTRMIQDQNVQAIVRILNCEESELLLKETETLLSRPAEQVEATRLLLGSKVFEKLGPIGEWDVVESILKAHLIEDLPLNILGELYNKIAISCWRQSKIDQAFSFTKRALAIGEQISDTEIVAEAWLSLANIHSWRGNTGLAIKYLRSVLMNVSHEDPLKTGIALSNLGSILYESGDLLKSEDYQKQALELFLFHGTAMNLSIAHCQLALLNLEKQNWNEATKHCGQSKTFAEKDGYARGIFMVELIEAELNARKGGNDRALALLFRALDGFAKLKIEESLNYQFAGRIYRVLGDLRQSKKYLEIAIDLAREFPLYQAFAFYEQALTKLLAGETAGIELSKAKELFTNCEALERVAMVNRLV